MTLLQSASGISVSASEIDTFEGCAARYAYSQYDAGDRLWTDPVPSLVSQAIHEAVMEFCRQVDIRVRPGVASSFDGPGVLRGLVDKHVARRGLHARPPEVQERLAAYEPGLRRVARMLVDDTSNWAVDPARPTSRLVWVEQPLNHGPGIPGVELQPGYLVRTRPDLIALRPVRGNIFRPVVRDVKARHAPVDPRADVGILVRGIWALNEAQAPRCPWFLARRSLPVDRERVDLEVVNLGFDGDSFHLRASLTADELLAHRDRFVAVLEEMHAARQVPSVEDVPASPGGLCHWWCPYLHRCGPGQDHVAKYVGEDELEARLEPG